MFGMGGIVLDISGSTVNTYLRGVNLIKDKSGYFLFNAHGDVVQHGSKGYKYDAFGNELVSNANDANPFRYAGEYFDSESETYYLRARIYDPSTGRFLSEDPIRDGLNFYTYGNGNPIFFIDPTGLAAVELRGWFNEKYGYIKEFYDDVSGVLAWNNATKTAFIRMEANGYSGYAEFSVGLDGTYIDPKTNRMYVDSGLLWQIFGRVIDPPLEHDYVGDAIVFAGGLFIAGALEFGGGGAAIGEAVKAGAAKVTGAFAGGAAALAPALQELYNRTADHIFSNAHVQNGILNLGNGTIDIFNKITNIANQYSSQWIAGSNEIRTVINGYETTIRFYIQNGQMINIDAFVGYSERVIGNLIK